MLIEGHRLHAEISILGISSLFCLVSVVVLLIASFLFDGRKVNNVFFVVSCSNYNLYICCLIVVTFGAVPTHQNRCSPVSLGFMPPALVALNATMSLAFEILVLLDWALWSLAESLSTTLQVVPATDRSLA